MIPPKATGKKINESAVSPARVDRMARAILSTLAGETADSLIFFPVAFGGIIAWRELLIMMCIQIILKSMYEVIILPVTIRVVKAIKKIDGSDVYDTDISYNVLKVKDI